MRLIEEINSMREELHGLLSAHVVLSESDIVDKSQKLDKLISLYYLQLQGEASLHESTL